MKGKKGFTLVEVIVVLIILAALAAILIPAMTGWIDRAKEKRLIVGCRACVLAAQTIVTETYGETAAAVVPDASAVVLLAGVRGRADGIALANTLPAIDKLTYDEGGDTVTYERLPTPHYTYAASSASAAAWTSGTQYSVGDTVVIDGVRFECVLAHTAGSSQYTRSPGAGSAGNKSRWKVVGYEDGSVQPYTYTYRYDEGMRVTYNGQVYERTGENPAVSPSPAGNPAYWTLIQ